jgi:peptidoglycan/xylan/chitin deacetylase (PgdA/CDA1 family)
MVTLLRSGGNWASRARITTVPMNPTVAPIAVGALAAAGGIAWGAVSPRSELFGRVVCHTANASRLALTFDDGPNPAVTPRLLELLERHSAHATFFVIGKFARACPELIRDIVARGHVLGNHSENHPNMFFLSPARIREELEQCQQAISAARVEPPNWMRPPYGYRSPLLAPELRRAGLRGMVTWSKICRDWKPQPPARLIRTLGRAGTSDVARGDIIVLHDGDHRGLGAERDYLLAALEYWLPRWRDAGKEFVTIETSA